MFFFVEKGVFSTYTVCGWLKHENTLILSTAKNLTPT